MSFQISKPSGILSHYIKQYWAIENFLPPGEKHIQRIVPNGLMELTFYFGDVPESLDNGKKIHSSSVLSGQQKGYYDLEVSGHLSMFSVSLKPCGARLFFGIPSDEYFNQNVPLNFILKNEVTELESRLYMSADFKGKIAVAENFFLNKIHRCSENFETNRMINSIGVINNSKGVISIDKLSEAACLSRKQFERTFTSYIGTTPKQFLRTIRFQNTLFRKHLNRQINFTQLAHSCGYFDQSHMINDYKILSGKTPSQYFGECEPYSDYFQ